MIASERVVAGRSSDAVSAGHASDAYRVARSLVVVLAVVVVDLGDVLDTGSWVRYAILLPPMLAVASVWGSVRSPFIRRPTASDRFLLVLLGWGLAGALIGRVFLGTETSALPIFLPMVLGLVHVWALQGPSDAEAARLVRLVSFIGLAYVALHALSSTELIPSLSAAGSYTHVKAFLIALAVAAAALTGRRTRTLIVLALAAVILIGYPAATYVVVAATIVATLFATGRRASPGRAFLVSAFVVAVIATALLNDGATRAIVDEYFQSVGKPSNVDTRIDLWREGIREVSSPIVGSSFAGEMSVPVSLEGGVVVRLALHNDYLQLALGGGIVAVACFLGWAVATNVLAVRRHALLVRAGRVHHAVLLRVLLVAFNAWLCVALFNSLLQSVGTSAALFAIYGLMMLAAVPGREPSVARA